MKKLLFLSLTLGACGPGMDSAVNVSSVPSEGAVSIRADVWADNWFAFYVDEQLILEDSVPITTERSFNAESFMFNVDLPAQLNFVFKDFKENDSGLEYIGARNQQMGDGGFIVQLFEQASGELLAYSNPAWKCLVIHEAPLDKSCEDEADPVAGEGACQFRALQEPGGWKAADFDDSTWSNAVEHSASAIDPKGGYDGVSWDRQARLMWSGDLETDNTLLCRASIR